MSLKSKETHELEKKSRCLACDVELRNHSILICAECLDDECGKFMKLAESVGLDEGHLDG